MREIEVNDDTIRFGSRIEIPVQATDKEIVEALQEAYLETCTSIIGRVEPEINVMFRHHVHPPTNALSIETINIGGMDFETTKHKRYVTVEAYVNIGENKDG